MSKTLCDWSKSDIESHPEQLLAIVSPPKFHCRKCARVANEKKHLCKPKKFNAQPDAD